MTGLIEKFIIGLPLQNMSELRFLLSRKKLQFGCPVSHLNFEVFCHISSGWCGWVVRQGAREVDIQQGRRLELAMAEVAASSPPACIYRISPEDEWAVAQAAGALQGSQLDASSGYIHLSTAAQVAGTLAMFFAGRSDLYLLKVDAAKLGDGLRYDEVEGGGRFPHFYGPPDGSFTPLPLSAVALSAKLELKNGKHVLPFDLVNSIS